MPRDIQATFDEIFPEPLIEFARRGGAAARRLGIAFERNPFPDGISMRDVEPALAEECAVKRAAWNAGWLQADADIWVLKHQPVETKR